MERQGSSARHGGMVAVKPLSPQGRRTFAKTPLTILKVIANWSSSRLVNLIEALTHFYKFHKNLCSLPITCRSSTKVGVAKLKV